MNTAERLNTHLHMSLMYTLFQSAIQGLPG